MDLEVEIKEEPIWHEETATTSLENVDLVSETIFLKQETKSEGVEPGPSQGNTVQENFEFVSETIPLKQETKSEGVEPGPTEDTTFQDFAVIKDEILVDEDKVDLLVPYVKAENNVQNLALLTMNTGVKGHCSTVDVMVFSQEFNPMRHMVSHSEEGPHVCNICNTVSVNKEIMMQHILNHFDDCSDTIRDHSGERPFECKECNKAFTKISGLRDHMLIHSGERKFRCNECNKTFAQRTGLRAHKFTHSSEKPFHCEECNKGFVHRHGLTAHMVTHGGERPFECDQCNAKFTRLSVLQNHWRRHSGEKPIRCEECNKGFYSASSLRKHMSIHTGKKTVPM